MEFHHVANDLINCTYLIRPPPKPWGFLVGEHPDVQGGGPPRFHVERHKGSVSKTLPDLALGVSSICIPYNKTVIISTVLSWVLWLILGEPFTFIASLSESQVPETWGWCQKRGQAWETEPLTLWSVTLTPGSWCQTVLQDARLACKQSMSELPHVLHNGCEGVQGFLEA